MNIDALFAIFFAAFLAVFLWKKRKRVQLEKALFPLLYVLMYRSSFGIISMERLAKKSPRLMRILGDIGIVVGFLGMALITWQLISGTLQLATNPQGAIGIQPVLPLDVKGVFFVPFAYWIISIFLLAIVHEFAHGVLARRYGIPVKSSGFAFLCILLPIIPAAFVEPDELVLQKKKAREQLSVFAAGPFANILFAVLMIGAFLAIAPALNAAFEPKGIELVSVSGPAESAGLTAGDVLIRINDTVLTAPQNLSDFLNHTSPGDHVHIETQNKSLDLVLGSQEKNQSQSFMGIRVKPFVEKRSEFMERYGAITPDVLKWFTGLIFWLFMLNVGIGLFNLLPIGPLDGGRMFKLVCEKLFRKHAMRVHAIVSLFFVLLILANLVIGFLR